MKKLFIALLVLTFLFSGCSNIKKNEPQVTPKTSQEEKNKESDQNKIKQLQTDYIVGLNSPVKGIQDWVDRYKPYEGVFTQKIGQYRVVLISEGEKFGKGYAVKVDKVTKKNDKWIVETTVVAPQGEDYSGTGVFPYDVVTFLNDKGSVEVVKSSPSNSAMSTQPIEIPEGKKLGVSKNFIVFAPFEGETIKSPVAIKGKARVFEAAFRISIEDGHYRLADKQMMSSEGAPGWGNFEVTLPFDKPTNPSGTIIFSYENMKNGDMIEELPLPVKF